MSVVISCPSVGLSFEALRGSTAESIYSRRKDGGVQSLGITRSGGIKISSEQYKARFICVFTGLATAEEAAILEYFFALKDTTPATQFVLADRYYYVDVVESTWHNRTQLEFVTVNGRARYYVAFNCFLGLPSGEPLTVRANDRTDWYRYSFIAEEIV